MNWVEHYNYWMVILLMMLGFYTIIARGNLVKKIIGLNIFQTSVFILFISMGKIPGGVAPILRDDPSYRLFKSATPCTDPHRHCRWRGHDSAGPGPGGAY